jgi:hypothetical protein
LYRSRWREGCGREVAGVYIPLYFSERSATLAAAFFSDSKPPGKRGVAIHRLKDEQIDLAVLGEQRFVLVRALAQPLRRQRRCHEARLEEARDRLGRYAAVYGGLLGPDVVEPDEVGS